MSFLRTQNEKVLLLKFKRKYDIIILILQYLDKAAIMGENKTIGKKIAELRKEKKLNQEEFADSIGVSRQSVAYWEKNLRIPKTDKIEEMCKKYNVSPGYFYGNGTSFEISATKDTKDYLPKTEVAEDEPETKVAENETKTEETLNEPKIKTSLRKTVILISSWIVLLFLIIIAVISIIIISSPNNDRTTVRVNAFDPLLLLIIFSVFLAVILIFLIIFTIKYIKKRK